MIKPRTILVCGGREYNDRAKVWQTLDSIIPWVETSFCIVHGSARGADQLAHLWAFFKGCAVIEMKANWDFYGKRAGSTRNAWMLEFTKPDLVIAFPGGAGTFHMVKLAESKGIPIWSIN